MTSALPDDPTPERPLAEVAVRVHEPGDAPESVARDVRKLTDWIRRHGGVESVLHHEAAGTIVVRYDERRAPGKLLQGALLDRLRAIRPARVIEAQQLEVSIAHEVPGRVRLRVGAISARGNTRGHDDAIE